MAMEANDHLFDADSLRQPILQWPDMAYRLPRSWQGCVTQKINEAKPSV